MVILYQSQTLPINSPSASPTLSIDEVWEVMLLKCRKPELFVAPMSSSAVIEETPTFMKRSVTFKEGMGPPGGEVIEELQIRAPWKVDFYNLNSGAFINNTVSQGKDETDLYLTFYFEWPYPDMQEGSKEAKEMSDKLWSMAKKTVQHTIDYARDMAKEAKLGKGLEH
ncbi:hypothetical protein OEA41_005312 [Lepraria neglecta]|uniref:DUF1857-domain-containing protein n=1 Tax=Lepraria neglecta TaxID=209136 RepID=A0AAE0DGN7_9LECA|nr:hypothetical protein OEA41_005312 [Lepraria neglecta]